MNCCEQESYITWHLGTPWVWWLVNRPREIALQAILNMDMVNWVQAIWRYCWVFTLSCKNDNQLLIWQSAWSDCIPCLCIPQHQHCLLYRNPWIGKKIALKNIANIFQCRAHQGEPEVTSEPAPENLDKTLHQITKVDLPNKSALRPLLRADLTGKADL